MHFSKTYAQLLLSLPPELQNNAIQYRQLKKLINQVVSELSSLGLDPSVLHELLQHPAGSEKPLSDPKEGTKKDPDLDGSDGTLSTPYNFPKAVYEISDESGHVRPRLRFWIDLPGQGGNPEHSAQCDTDHEVLEPLDTGGRSGSRESRQTLLWALQKRSAQSESCHNYLPPSTHDRSIHDHWSDEEINSGTNGVHEVVIPLVSDCAFFESLSAALESLSAHLVTVHTDFVGTLENLTRAVGGSARPASSAPSFRPFSLLTSNAAAIRVSRKNKRSDLYSWREIFQLYVEAEVFESVREANRGERSVEESEHRLKLFAERVTRRGFGDGRQLKLQQSRVALETFLRLNLFILNIKKFQLANAEATRKILKKHTKRTALLLTDTQPNALCLQVNPTSLPRVLVQAIGEILLPIIPHLDDYSCLICMSIAFKPIRLDCGHLFCVRCLVKMQKRGQGHCPMCRAPSVLTANRSNVDWALLNFMQDWFPVESKKKLDYNEREAAREQLAELGLNPNQACVIM